MQRIQLIEGDVWGHRKDINEYYRIPSSIIEEIKELKIEGKSTEAIEEKVSRESKLNPEMVAYILRKDVIAWYAKVCFQVPISFFFLLIFIAL